MTLESSLHNHNDAALEALTSKGLVRRARRDLQAGKAQIEDAGEDVAKILADGQTVVLDGRGPTAAHCTCPANGVCRHILLAVMAMQEQVANTGEEAPLQASATNDVGLIPVADLIKFAGADWKRAAALVVESIPVEFVENGPSVTVSVIELDSKVTFIAGHGLKGAVYKGPGSRMRLMVTASALLLQRREGVLSAEVEDASVASDFHVSAEFIDQAQEAIEQAVAIVLLGKSAIGYDRISDLAISARTEALPRLSAELRALANQSRLALDRDVAFEADVFLKESARAYALLEALRTAPHDPLLTGTVRRDYRQERGVDLWSLGVSRWGYKTGARGLSAYFYEPHQQAWMTMNEGRAAGMDPGFDVSNAYSMPVWGAGTIRGLVGKRIRLGAPMISADGSLSPRSSGNASIVAKGVSMDELLESGAMTRQWRVLRRDLGSRFGVGLRRIAVPQPALIAPADFVYLGFNDLDQTYEWELPDEQGDTLVLSVAGDEHKTANRLRRLGRKISALVIEVTPGRHDLVIRPVAIVSKGKQFLSLHNVDFDAWPVERGIKKTLTKLGESMATAPARPVRSLDALGTLAANALDAITGTIGHSPSARLDEIHRQSEASGLVLLASAIDVVKDTQSVRAILKAAYLAGEIEAALMFE